MVKTMLSQHLRSEKNQSDRPFCYKLINDKYLMLLALLLASINYFKMTEWSSNCFLQNVKENGRVNM